MMMNHCLLFLVVATISSIVTGRKTLLENSSPERVIPDRLYNLPLARQRDERLKSQTWSLLEPREISERSGSSSGSSSSSFPTKRPATRPARYTGEKLCEGACISSRSCEYHEGIIKGHCNNGNVCCIFQKSCGGVTKEKVSFFRSPHFPHSTNYSLECSYRINLNSNTCALKIDFELFHLMKPKQYTKVVKCVDDLMFVLNSAHGAIEGVCQMENHTAIVEVDPHSSHSVALIVIAQSRSFSWDLRITQINCKNISPWKNVPTCGRQLMYEDNEYDSDIQPETYDNIQSSSSSSSGKGNQQLPLPRPLIVNGKDAELREFPWQISLQLKSNTSTHRCGGTIINEKHILTAAHCVFRVGYISKEKLKVIVGDYILETEEDGKHLEFGIDSIIVHYGYKPSHSHVNDIAVIRLNETISFNDKVQPVCLPDKDFVVYDKKAIVTGWGQLSGTDPKAKALKLQKLDMKIISNELCKEMVKKEYEQIFQKNLTYEIVARSSIMGLTDTQLCALAKTNSTACSGDSGGPLVIQHEDDGRYIQAGVVSYGLGKCRTNRPIPGSYTNVKKYLHFIALATSNVI